MNRWINAHDVILAAALVGLAGCGQDVSNSSDAASTAAGSSIPVIGVTAGELREVIEVPASVEGYETADLVSKIDGYVREVHVNIGDYVSADHVLAELYVPELEDEVVRQQKLVEQAAADIDTHEAEIALAEAKLQEQSALLNLEQVKRDRLAKLVDGGALSQQRLDEAEYGVEAIRASVYSTQAQHDAARAHLASGRARLGVAQAELRKAESMASYAQIKAPFEGLITRRQIDPGAFVRPATAGDATALLGIARVDKVRVVVFLPMEDAAKLQKGDRVVLRGLSSSPTCPISELSGQPLRVSRLASSFDHQSRMMRAEIDVDNQMLQREIGKRLRPGDYGIADLLLADYTGYPTVPSAAVGQDAQGDRYVVRADATNNYRRVAARVLYDNGELAVVAKEGEIQIGDRLVETAVEDIADSSTLDSD